MDTRSVRAPSARPAPGTPRPEGEAPHLAPRELAPNILPGPGHRPATPFPWRTAGKFAYAFLAVLCVVAIAYPFLPRRYEASALVVIQPTDLDGQTDRTLRQPLDENALQSGMDVIASPALADRVIAAHGLDSDPEFAGGGARALLAAILPAAWLPAPAPARESEVRRRLQDHLQVSRDRRSYTIRLGYWSSDPTKAAAMTATLLAAYLDEQRDRKRAGLRHLTEWLDRRAALLAERHTSSRNAAQAFRESSGLIDTGAQVELDQRLQVLSGEAAQARARFIDASTRSRNLLAMREAGTLDTAPEVIGSPSVMRLKEGMAAALARTAVWANETQAFEGQIKGESERIVAAAVAETENWAGRERLLLAEIKLIRGRIVERRQSEQRLQELQRTADSDRVVLDEALTRQKGMTARTESVGPDVEVLSSPEAPNQAAFPRPGLTLLAALLLATLAGLVAVRGPLLAALRRLATA